MIFVMRNQIYKKNYYVCIINSKTRHICDRYEQKPKTKNTWIRKGGLLRFFELAAGVLWIVKKNLDV